MANILNKVLDFVGWETVENTEEEFYEEDEDFMEDTSKNDVGYSAASKKQHGKVLNLSGNSSLKVVVVQPQNISDAKEICDHLRENKPIIMNLEDVEKDIAQRIVDFVSGSVYSLDGNIQKVSSGIFLTVPRNVDIMGNIKDDLKSKGVFPWVK